MLAPIRPYQENDAAAVVDLSLRAWEPVFASLKSVLGARIFDLLHPDWSSDQRRAVEATLSDPSMQIWVAHIDDRAVGFVAVRLDSERSVGEVYMIAVDPNSQQHRIGSGLMAQAIDWIAGAGMAVAMVETGGDPGHAPARRMYEAAGFSPLPAVRYFKALDA